MGPQKSQIYQVNAERKDSYWKDYHNSFQAIL